MANVGGKGLLLKQVRPYTLLRMLVNYFISYESLRNFLRSLGLQFAEFIVNPLRILRMLASALRMKRLHNAYAVKPLANVSLCHFYSPGYLE